MVKHCCGHYALRDLFPLSRTCLTPRQNSQCVHKGELPQDMNNQNMNEQRFDRTLNAAIQLQSNVVRNECVVKLGAV